MFSFTWQFYAVMGNHVYEINDWGRCQRSSLKHLKPNAHSVIYRLVSSGQQQGGKGRPGPPGGPPPEEEDDLLDPEMEDWDSLINNLYRTSGNATNHFTSSTAHQKGSSRTSPTGPASHQGNGMNSSATTTAAGKSKRKGKRK